MCDGITTLLSHPVNSEFNTKRICNFQLLLIAKWNKCLLFQFHSHIQRCVCVCMCEAGREREATLFVDEIVIYLVNACEWPNWCVCVCAMRVYVKCASAITFILHNNSFRSTSSSWWASLFLDYRRLFSTVWLFTASHSDKMRQQNITTFEWIRYTFGPGT